MEQLILIIAFGLIALIAMSQCAHHSSRCHQKLDTVLMKRPTVDATSAWNHTTARDEVSEEATQGTDREPYLK